jgi:hypothetical protein
MYLKELIPVNITTIKKPLFHSAWAMSHDVGQGSQKKKKASGTNLDSITDRNYFLFILRIITFTQYILF